MTDREAFEDWCNEFNLSKSPLSPVLWRAWKASRKQALEEAAIEFDKRAFPDSGWYEVNEPAKIIRNMK